MKRLVLVRHAPALWLEGPEDPRYRGWSDAPLGDEGLTEARLVAARLAGQPLDRVLSSDLRRARQTAEEIASRHGLEVCGREEFREMNFGRWEGASHKELLEEDDGTYRSWLEDPYTVAPPGGETFADLARRTRAGFEALRRESVGETVALVGHGGPLRLLVCYLIGAPDVNHWRIRLDRSSISIVDFAGDMSVVSLLNDRSHLGGAG